VSSIEATIVEAQRIGGVRRYEVRGLDGVRVAVVIRHSGERKVVLLTEDDDEPVLTLSFTAAQACALASVLTDVPVRRDAASDG
jgi:K+/H+ antiporter YhaU regulatory subunit KhtT